MERQANALLDQIAEVARLRGEAAAEERSRPHLPTVRTALQDVAALSTELDVASVDDRLALRMRITHQIRIAFAAIVFGPHSIAGLIALPGKPRMTGAFGFPMPIVTKKEGDAVRYFYRHTVFSDEPEMLATMDGGTGVLGSRFSGRG